MSPAQAGISSPTMPASEMPELKVYWLLVPLGQTEPGIVEDPVESTQIWPLEMRPHCTWLTLSDPLARASRRKPDFLIGRSGSAVAPAAGAASISARATSHAETTVRRQRNSCIASSLESSRTGSTPGPRTDPA